MPKASVEPPCIFLENIKVGYQTVNAWSMSLSQARALRDVLDSAIGEYIERYGLG